MARLFVTLANDDPPAEPADLSHLIDIENRIAEGMSIPSGLNCPTCRSALYEIKEAPRRCVTGCMR